MELAQEACQRIKAECEFIALKWDELIPGLLEKKFDIIMSSMEVTRERRQRMGLSRRYYLSPGAFLAPKGAPYDGPPSLLRNKRIGIQKDSTHADWADKSFRRSAQRKRYNTTAEALDALANDDVDVVFGDKAQLWLWSRKPEGKCCELVGQDIKDTQTLGAGVAAGASASAVGPKCWRGSPAGADSPERSMPITRPSRPTYLYQPSVVPASTAMRGRPAGSTLAL